MVKQYPHTLLFTVADQSTIDSGGDFEVDSTPTTEQLKCRAEPSNSNDVIPTSDGGMIHPMWIVYMPRRDQPIEVGTQVEITNQDGYTMGKGTVKKFSLGDQLHSRMWI